MMIKDEQARLEMIRANLSAAQERLKNHLDIIRHDRIALSIVENGIVDYDYVADKLFEHQMLVPGESVIEKMSFLLSEEVTGQEEAAKAREFLRQLVDSHFCFNLCQRGDIQITQ
jgi:hypothetical protein